MGKSEYSRTVAGSDSGYGDETTERSSSSSLHPLARKGYEIGPASKLQIGDVFEFLWADCPEFKYEWKCLGYTRFIVLRHSDSFPHYCTCVPISVGAKKDFAKPGIDSLQQGYVYASGERERDRDGSDSQVPYGQQKGLPQLPYSSVGIHLHSGRHRVKDDSRANYADVVEVDHEAQVMVVGDVARYFDRVRKNVNKAFMRQILRDALGDYCQRKKIESEAANVRGWGNSTVSLVKSSADDAERDNVVQGTEMDVDETQTEDMHMHAHGDGEAHLDEKYTEGSLSDETKDEDEDEWWDRQSTYTVNHAQSAERRASRAAQRAKATSRSGSPGQEAEVAWRAGMDRAGLRSLRNLRRGAPSTDDYDDTLSLRSLAMAGRTPSILSRRSRR